MWRGGMAVSSYPGLAGGMRLGRYGLSNPFVECPLLAQSGHSAERQANPDSNQGDKFTLCSNYGRMGALLNASAIAWRKAFGW